MNKEEIIKILSKIKDTVGENNYKLALAITGHKTGKIKDIIMCSKDGELLLEYIENLQSQLKAKEETINKAIKHVSSLSSKGRGCEIYADVKRDILEILSKGENK